MGPLAVSGASGKTGWRVVDEALQRGVVVRAIVRPNSVLPPSLAEAEQQGRLEVFRLELATAEALHHALSGCTALVIATGARPSLNLAGPLQVDAFGVRSQLSACAAVGLQRVVLVSSLCAGRWRHPLNLFGLILSGSGLVSAGSSKVDWIGLLSGLVASVKTTVALSKKALSLQLLINSRAPAFPADWLRRCAWMHWLNRALAGELSKSPVQSSNRLSA